MMCLCSQTYEDRVHEHVREHGYNCVTMYEHARDSKIAF